MPLDLLFFDVATQICDNVKNNSWLVTKDPKGRVGPYASKHDQWVSYDDVSDVTRKVCATCYMLRVQIYVYDTSSVSQIRDSLSRRKLVTIIE